MSILIIRTDQEEKVIKLMTLLKNTEVVEIEQEVGEVEKRVVPEYDKIECCNEFLGEKYEYRNIKK